MAVNFQEIKFIQVCIIICYFQFYDDTIIFAEAGSDLNL